MSSPEALMERASALHEATRYREELELLDEAITALRERGEDDPTHLLAQVRRIHALRMCGRNDLALEAARPLEVRCAALGDARLRASALLALAYCLNQTGDVAGTRRAASTARQIGQVEGVVYVEASAQVLLAGVHMRTGQLVEADAILAQASRLTEPREHLHEHARVLAARAEVLTLRGALDEAARIAAAALDAATTLGQPYARIQALNALALAHQYAGRPHEAADYAAQGEALTATVGDLIGLYNAITARGDAARALGQLAEALGHHRRALALPGLSRRLQSFARLNISISNLMARQLQEAALEADQLWESHGGTVRAMAAMLGFAAAGSGGDLERAAMWERRVRQVLPTLGRAEPELAELLRRAAQDLAEPPQAPAEALCLAARALSLAWPAFDVRGREQARARVESALAALGERGAPLPLGPYDLVERVGAGGMGEVWRARNRDSGELAAVKLVTASAARTEAAMAALRAEARAVARLNHANVVGVHDSGVVDGALQAMTQGRLVAGSPALVMELCDTSLLSRCGRLDWPACRELLVALLRALAHAHARGLVHLDLKPDNVLLLGDQPRLTDFGLVWAIGEAVGRVAGTPAYMSPEQIRGDWRSVGPWTDLYALGCLAWALVTGSPPYGGGDHRRVMERKLTEDVRSLTPGAPMPLGLRRWLNRLLARSPAARYALAADALAELPPADAPLELGGARGAPEEALTSAPESFATFLLDEVPAAAPAPPEEPGPPPAAAPPPDWRDRAERLAPASSSLTTFGLREVPLVGREREREALWDALLEPGRRLVVITGAAGVGKTRLLEWLVHRAHETGAAWTVALTGGPGASLRAPLRWSGLTGPALRAAIAEELRLDEARAVRAVAELVEPGAHLASPPTPPERARALRLPLDRLAAGRGVILTLDDAHADSESLALLDLLLADPDAPPMLVVVVARDDGLALAPEANRALLRLCQRPGARRLTLPPLPDGVLVALLSSRLRLEPSLASALTARADGNPQFALELVGTWVQRGELVHSDAGFVLREGGTAPIPEGLAAVWARRVAALIEGLPPGADATLELAATFGLECRDDDWRAVAGALELPPPGVVTERLLDAHLLERRGPRWRLAHAMLREALLERARRSGRAIRWHAAVADRLEARGEEPAEVALHRFEAGQLDEGMSLIRERGRAALIGLSTPAVLRVLDAAGRALVAASAPPSDPRRLEIRQFQASTLHASGRYGDAIETLSEVVEIAAASGQEELWALSLAQRAAALRQVGRLEEAVRAFEEAQPVLEASGDTTKLVQALFGRAMGLSHLGRHEHALLLHGRALALTPDPPTWSPRSGVLMGMSASLEALGRLPEARAAAHAAVDAARRTGRNLDLCMALCALGDIERRAGASAAAEAPYLEALDRARRASPALVRVISLNLGLLEVARARWPEARSWLGPARDELARQGRPLPLVVAQVALLAPCFALGRLDEFDAAAVEASRMLERTGLRDRDAAWAAGVARALAGRAGDRARAHVAETLGAILAAT